jgi:hypothetical protein
MSETHTDLVIQISTSGPESAGTIAEKAEDSQLITELQRCLQPGVEIALVFEGYMAMTSILWLSEPPAGGSVRAGVRLLGVSALPGDPPEEPAGVWVRTPGRAAIASSSSVLVRRHL